MHARFWSVLMTAVLLVALVCGSAFAISFSIFDRGIKGSGDLETRDLDLDDFDEVRIDAGFDLDISFGKHQQVSVTLDDNLWENFVAKVKGGVLILDWDEKCRPDRDTQIEIVVRELKAVMIHGAGDVDIHDFRGDEFAFKVSGAGDLDIDGEVDDLLIKISGAGDVDARQLIAKNVEVTISGAGDAKVYASESIEARVSGVGNVTYYGEPEHKKSRVSGIGHIAAR